MAAPLVGALQERLERAIGPAGVVELAAFDPCDPAARVNARSACTGAALSRLGFADAAVSTGPHGRPVWPPGIAGSISYAAGLACAAVAPASAWGRIGLDLEQSERVTEDVRAYATLQTERDHHAELAATHEAPWAALAFCAKEATYKAWPEAGPVRLDFPDLEVRFSPIAADHGTFVVAATRAEPSLALAAAAVRGRWWVVEDLVACLALAAAPQPAAAAHCRVHS